MIHSNSIASYNALKASGALSDQESEAVAEVVARGPGTSRELDERIGHGGRAWHPTFHRLERRGVFFVVEERACSISGKTAMVYGYTGATTAPKLQGPVRPTRKDIRAFLLNTPVPNDTKLVEVRNYLLEKYK